MIATGRLPDEQSGMYSNFSTPQLEHISPNKTE